MAASKEMELAIKIAGKIDSSFNSALSKVSSGIKGATKAMAAGTAAAAAAVGTLTLKAVDIGREYETAMSQVQATMLLDTGTEAGAAAMQTLEDAARAAGRSTAFSATEAAEALNYLALAGYDADKAAAALPTVLTLAGAGAMQLKDASDMVTDAMSALRIEATQENLESFADQMAKTASISNTSVQQLGEAILAVGGTAADLKGGTAELNAVAGILADVGIKGSEGGTHIRNMIQSITNARNKDAAGLFEEMGFSAYDAEGKLKSLGESFGDINRYMEGMNPQQVNEVISTIFKQTDLASARAMLAATADSFSSLSSVVNSSMAETGQSLEGLGIDLEQMAATFDATTTREQFAADMLQKYGVDAETAGLMFEGLSSIVGGTGNRFDELTGAIEGSAGAAEEMYRIQLDNLNGDLKILRSGIEDIGISVFKDLAPALRSGVQLATDMVGEMSTAYQEGGLKGLAGSLGGCLSEAVDVIGDYAPQAVDLGVELVDGLVSGIADNAPGIATAGAGVLVSFTSGMFRLVPLVLLAGVDIVLNLVRGLTQQLPAIADNGAAATQNFVSGILERLPIIIRAGPALTRALVQSIIRNAPGLIQSGIQLIGGLLGGIAQMYPELVRQGLVLVLGLAAAILQNLPLLIRTGAGLISSIINAIGQNLENFAVAGAALVRMLVSGIVQNLPTLIQAGGGLVMQLFGVIIRLLPSILSGGAQIVAALAQGIAQALPLILQGAADLIMQLLSGIIAHLPTITQTGAGIISNLINGLASMLPGIVATAATIIFALISGVLNMLPDIITAGAQLIVSLVRGIINNLPVILQTAIQIVNGLISGVAGNLGSFARAGVNIIIALASGLISMIPTLLAAIPQLAAGIVKALFSIDWLGVGGDIIKGIGSGIAGGFGAIGDAVGGFFSKIASGGGEKAQAAAANNIAGQDAARILTAQTQAGLTGSGRGFKDTGQQAAAQYVAGVKAGSSALSAATQAAVNGSAQGLNLAAWSQAGQRGAASLTGGIDGTLAAYNLDTGMIGVDNSTLTGVMGTAGRAGGLAFTGGLDGSLRGYSFDTSAIGVDTSALTAMMGESGTAGSGALISGITEGITGYTVDTSGVAIDTSGISGAFEAAGQAGGQTFTAGLDQSLAGYTFNPSSVGLDVSAFTTDLTAAAESGGSAFTAGLDSSISGYSFDTSAIGVDTSALTATLTEGGKAGGQGLIDGLTSAIEAGNFDPAAVANVDDISSTLQEAGARGGEAFTAAIGASVDAYSFDPANTGIEPGIMAESMTQSGTAGGQALTQSLQQAITSGSPAVVSAADALGAGVADAIESGFERAENSASSSMASIHSICTSGAQRTAAAVKNAFESMTITIPRPRIPVVSVWSSSVPVGDQSVTIPHFSVSWNALGGIFDKATIFNTAAGLQGVGEKGPEAILPLNTLWTQMRKIMTEILRSESGVPGMADSLLSRLQNIGGGGQGAGEMRLAGAGGETIYFSPTYNLYGSATQEDAERAGKATFEEFKKFMKQYVTAMNLTPISLCRIIINFWTRLFFLRVTFSTRRSLSRQLRATRPRGSIPNSLARTKILTIKEGWQIGDNDHKKNRRQDAGTAGQCIH